MAWQQIGQTPLHCPFRFLTGSHMNLSRSGICWYHPSAIRSRGSFPLSFSVPAILAVLELGPQLGNFAFERLAFSRFLVGADCRSVGATAHLGESCLRLLPRA